MSTGATVECPVCRRQVNAAIAGWHANECLNAAASAPPPPAASAKAQPQPVPQPRPPAATASSAAAKAHPSRESSTPANEDPSFECPICLEDFPISHLFTFDCPGSHRMCFGCTGEMIDAAIRSKEFAKCPAGCNVVIRSIDVAAALRKGARNAKEDPRVAVYREIELQNMLGACVYCPTKGCKFCIEVPQELRQQPWEVRCASCKVTFCSSCRVQPYHPGRPCRDANELKVRWLAFQTEVNAHKLTAKFVADQRALLARYEELRADEEYKARTCRMCPKCNRPIEKLEGCDLMVCGRNYHGGDDQNGCGHHFGWGQAQPYVAQLPPAPKLDNVRAELACEHHHGEFHRCEFCKKEVVGPRFTCGNCVGEFDCCFACLPRLERDHPRGHFFVIHTVS